MKRVVVALGFAKHLHLRRWLLVGLVLVVVSGAACSLLPEADSPDEAPTALAEVTEAAVASPTVPATTEPTPEPTSTPEPTPILPQLAVSDQTITEDGVITVAAVVLPEDGWLAIYDAEAISDAGLLSVIPIDAGAHDDVTVEVDPRLATETLEAVLYAGRESGQSFTIPEDEGGSGVAAETFTVAIELPQPEVVVTDQEVGDDGELLVDELFITEPTWVLVHTDEDGASGLIVGRLLLEPGLYEDVVIPIRWREGTPTLHVVLHEDTGESGVLDYPVADLPFVVEGEPVTASFEVTYPPDVVVYDQPVVNGEIIIERVISDGPGWVAVHFDDNGQPGLIIGSVALEDGLNEQLSVDLIESAITPILYARLHTDSEPGGEFEFPQSDPPVRYENRLPEANAFRVNVGSYLIIEDQALSDGMVVVAPLVVSVADAWLAIYADDEGQIGELLGQTRVAEGLNRDVEVALEADPGAGLLHAVLYQNLGDPDVFEPPPGPDSPFRVLGAMIDVPFSLLPPPERE